MGQSVECTYIYICCSVVNFARWPACVDATGGVARTALHVMRLHVVYVGRFVGVCLCTFGITPFISHSPRHTCHTLEQKKMTRHTPEKLSDSELCWGVLPRKHNLLVSVRWQHRHHTNTATTNQGDIICLLLSPATLHSSALQQTLSRFNCCLAVCCVQLSIIGSASAAAAYAHAHILQTPQLIRREQHSLQHRGMHVLEGRCRAGLQHSSSRAGARHGSCSQQQGQSARVCLPVPRRVRHPRRQPAVSSKHQNADVVSSGAAQRQSGQGNSSKPELDEDQHLHRCVCVLRVDGVGTGL